VDDPKQHHVVFLDVEARTALGDLDPEPFAPERAVAVGRELHLHLPGGIGRSPLATALTRAGRADRGTTRGWRTVSAVADLAAATA